MKDWQRAASAANIIGYFLARRDIDELSQEAMQAQIGQPQADVLIAFGGMIPHGCDIVARSFQRGLAKRLLLVGGIGHTTEVVRAAYKDRVPELDVEGRAEADIMADYLKLCYGIEDVLIENRSTNCGNNVTYALGVLKENGIAPKSVLIMQDATMQLRMAATFQKVAPDIQVVNYAPYRPAVISKGWQLGYLMDYWGMWSMEHYLSLLLGEVERLRDDANGYGPNGADYLAHVDLPTKVETAARFLHGFLTRMDALVVKLLLERFDDFFRLATRAAHEGRTFLPRLLDEIALFLVERGFLGVDFLFE